LPLWQSLPTSFESQLIEERKQADAFVFQSFLNASEWIRSAAIDGLFGDPQLLDKRRIRELKEGFDQFQRLLPLYEQRVESAPANANYRGMLASAQFQTGMLRMTLGLPEADLPTREALRNFERLFRDAPDELEYQLGIAYCHFNLGQLATRERHFEAAVEHFRSAQSVAAPLAGTLDPDDLRMRMQLGEGFALGHLGRLAEARDVLNRLSPDLEAIERNEQSPPEQRGYAGRALYSLGLISSQLGQLPQALQEYERAAKLQRNLVEMYGVNNQFRSDYIRTLTNRGLVLWAVGQIAPARESLEEGLSHAEKLVERAPVAPVRFDYGVTSYHLASLLFGQGMLAQAQERLEHSIDQLLLASESSSADPRYQPMILEAFVGLSRLLLQRGDHQRAVETIQDAVPWIPPESNQFVDAARLVCQAMSLAQNDPQLSGDELESRSREYGDLAIRLLGDAIRLGWDSGSLKVDPTLAPLHHHADFFTMIESSKAE
jgi:tetratricopeptide (TPR) repeat protein